MIAGAGLRILVVDNYDSFVFTLVSYLRELGADVDVVEGTELGVDGLLARARGADGVLISPGPGRPEDVPASVALIGQARTLSQPLLGVCLGHQVLVHALGGRVQEGPDPVHGRTSRIRHDGDPLFAGLPSGFAGMRYHSLLVDRESLPGELQVIAVSEEGIVMGVRHREAPLVGVQFHPESVLTEGGHKLIDNWLADIAARKPPAR
ncbi:anthranilate synthase component II [Rathayibacter tanaceti]|uniref:Para-aminobenzoate synthetase component 2 n=2 Tax=Rathayibacter tanaceti TaxID=1671680 RepID=A0ACD2XL97_9MICO|nr:aminodeoxychorismate/anthranilate synthase component II [Rathayibacter tanaceti]KZX22504.1 Anthranilate synthase component 2 [Rathayibacter tanaceti]TCO37885.1 para-aminobenzoate synthetase component 2 [Rathayibacter tanaceti]